MHENILKKLKELNDAVAQLSRSEANRSRLASSFERFEIEGEIAKFLRQAIVLLPPEASAEYCSKCGKKL